ncbi:MAG: hypothetical protein AAFO07_24905 [Bacteroidota bacterium]
MAQQLYRSTLLQRFNDDDLQSFVLSTLNKLEDGIDIDDNHGLKLDNKGTSKALISFYESLDENPVWKMSFGAEGTKAEGLNISEGNTSRIFIKNGGNVGISNANPNFRLHVDGIIAAKGFVGTYNSGFIPANGKWHTVLTGISDCQAYEAFAHIYNKNDQRFGLTHALLMMSGKNGYYNKVKSVDASSRWLWGRFMNRIKFRWVEEEGSSRDAATYSLEIRSRSRHGMPNGGVPNIYYRLTKVWDKDFENENQDFGGGSGNAVMSNQAAPVKKATIKTKPSGGITIKPSKR